MIKKPKNFKTIDTVEREREREKHLAPKALFVVEKIN